MAGDADLMQRPVTELAALVRRGELSALELVEASLARIAALEPAVNAFVDVDREGALKAAAAIEPGDERPFAGVPIAIKNNRAVRGLRLTRCADLMGEFVAQHDHSVVRRLRAAGFVVVGTTALPEWGILPVTEPRRGGPARNPWDLDAHARRVVGRLGGRGRRRHGPDRARQRRRRIAEDPGGVLRPRRPEAVPRARLAGSRRRRELPAAGRRPDAHGARDRAAARRARRPGARRRVVGTAAARAVRGHGGARARAACASA